jgi:tyrosyl-tRNA synthetase
MLLRHLQRSGHKPVVLIGGGTTKIGDPTGKDESRKLLSEDQIAAKVASIKSVFQTFLHFGDGPTDAVLVNNADWLDKINYLEFLRDYGKHFTVNRLLSFESVKQRLERTQPFSFLEFNYLLLQSYDFLHLSRSHKAVLQIGGSDQWGNIVSGIELARKVDKSQLFGLTAPLITTSDGGKMGKTEGGAVWLNKTLVSEYDYWQFWRNTTDSDVMKFMKLFTELPMERIWEMEKWEGSQLNAAKVILADEATKLLHGEACLSGIHAAISALYAKKGGLESLSSLPQVVLEKTHEEKLQNKTLSVIELLMYAQLADSKSEARRTIKAGAARINDVKVDDEDMKLGLADLGKELRFKLSSGKKRHVLVLLPSHPK